MVRAGKFDFNLYCGKEDKPSDDYDLALNILLGYAMMYQDMLASISFLTTLNLCLYLKSMSL